MRKIDRPDTLTFLSAAIILATGGSLRVPMLVVWSCNLPLVLLSVAPLLAPKAAGLTASLLFFAVLEI